MRFPTSHGIELIKYFEGFSSSPYRCPAGLITIGFGHVIMPGEVFAPEGVSREQGVDLLKKDAAVAARSVLRLIRVPLTDGQFDALVSFTFNLGGGALQRSSLRRKINRMEYEEVSAELRRWVWAGGSKLPGLIRRREAEILRYLS